MKFDYFYGRQAEQFSFYQIPKLLITDERFADISMDAKLLYSLMLDRSSLSSKNGWLDNSGRVYIFYTLEQIMQDMHCANQKATKLLKELEIKANLIERKKQGQGKPTRIYVKDFATGLHVDKNKMTHENHDSESNVSNQTHENHESRDVIFTDLDSWNSATNKTDTNKTDFSVTDSINPSDDKSHIDSDSGYREETDDAIKTREKYESYLKGRLEYEIMLERYPYDQKRIDEIIELMVDVLCSKAKTIRISQEDKPTAVVQEQFMKLDCGHLQYILDAFHEQTTEIRNIKQYLLTTIYNAPLTIDHYYMALVQHDMAQ